MGMSSEEYWFGDPSLLYNYQNAFNLKQKYDLQMAWAYGAYFKSALGSTVVWTTQPMKKTDLNKMPEYAEYPIKETRPPKPISEEKRKLIEETREKLNAMGLLRKSSK